jgi:glycosyltransferase involved in cell wall biosynthesis
MQEQNHVAVVLERDADSDAAQALHQAGARALAGYQLELLGTPDALRSQRHDLLHLAAAGPAADRALAIAQSLGVPVIAGYQAGPHPGLEHFYRGCQVVLSCGAPQDAALSDLGVAAERIARWQPGVDFERFHPARYTAGVLPSERFNILHVGPLAGGAQLLAESFLIAHARQPRLHLVLAGRAPADASLTSRLAAATFMPGLDDEELSVLFASADLLLHTGGSGPHVIFEAQASGLPVLAVSTGEAATLIEDGRSGCLVPPDPEAIAQSLRVLARRDAVRDRLATGGLLAVRGRTWERSLAQLADGYALALRLARADRGEVAAAAGVAHAA